MQLNKPFATVTPTLDGDVLATLASAEATFTIAQIQRILTTASGEGIRKVLTRLTAQGVVLHDRVGRTHTYRLNGEHLAADPILALARLTSTFLARLENHLNGWKELKYAAMFGSAATGRMRLDSDIDLFLVRASPTESADHGEPDLWDEQVTELSRLVTAWTGNDGRVVEYTEDDLAAAVSADEALLRDVAEQGLTVAGTRSWFIKRLRPTGDPLPQRGGSDGRRRDCDSAITAGRMSKAIEFFDAAEHLADEMPNAAGDLYVDAGIAASDAICCVRLGVHSNTGNHSEAVGLLKQADSGSERYLNILLSLKSKAAYTHQHLTPAELRKMNRAAENLVEAAKRIAASRT